MTARCRVLVVDDSSFMRQAVSRLLTEAGVYEVVGHAADGLQAVEQARALRPDLITMDFNMPGLDGAAATRAILSERTVPIVMLSAHTRAGARETVGALAAGAVDFVAKPDGEVSVNLTSIRDELLRKLAMAVKVRLEGPFGSAVAAEPTHESAAPSLSRCPPGGVRLLVLAASTGGPAALARIVPELRLGPATTALIVQHLPAGFTAALAEQLAARSPFAVREVADDQELIPGVALVAAGDRHLRVDRAGRCRLGEDPPVHGVRPAADVTLRSAAPIFGARLLAVVLTGMGQDGALGAAAVKAAGGRTLAQDRASSTVYGMPRAAVELGVIDQVVPLPRLAETINRCMQ